MLQAVFFSWFSGIIWNVRQPLLQLDGLQTAKNTKPLSQSYLDLPHMALNRSLHRNAVHKAVGATNRFCFLSLCVFLERILYITLQPDGLHISQTFSRTPMPFQSE